MGSQTKSFSFLTPFLDNNRNMFKSLSLFAVAAVSAVSAEYINADEKTPPPIVTEAYVNGTLQYTFGAVKFTHCGSGGQCGGHQKCSNYELALSDANIWRALGLRAPAGGVNSCPTSYFDSNQDCCDWNTCPDWVKRQVPDCPLDSHGGTDFPVCVTASNGRRQTAYVTGCCPYHHPCNLCKTQFHQDGGCNNWSDQADLCDNLWYALGAPSQSTTLSITTGNC